MGTDTTMERDLLMLSPLPMLLPTLRLRLILGTDTTDMDTGHMDMDTMDTAHTDMATIMERGLLMLSPLPKPLPTLRLRLILGTDTTDMDTGHMDMDTMDTAHTDTTDTGHMDMDTTVHMDTMDTMERGLLMLSPM